MDLMGGQIGGAGRAGGVLGAGGEGCLKQQTLSSKVLEELARRDKELQELYGFLCEISNKVLPSIPVVPCDAKKGLQPPQDTFSLIHFGLCELGQSISVIREIVLRLHSEI